MTIKPPCCCKKSERRRRERRQQQQQSTMQFFLLFLILCHVRADSGATTTTTEESAGPHVTACASWSGATCGWEPDVQVKDAQFGSTTQQAYVYLPPAVGSYYNETGRNLKKETKPRHTGMFGKFINMSPADIHVYYEAGGAKTYISTVPALGSAGTATYPGHKFVATPVDDKEKVLQKWTVKANHALHYYDPFNFDYAAARKALTSAQLSMYALQLNNKVYAEQYRSWTGTDWLALYGHKKAPRFHQWRADFLNQVHTVETEAIQFTSLPDDETLSRGVSRYGPRPDELERVRRYRQAQPVQQFQLRVLSCAPRVFEIENFLSATEVQHLLNVAASKNMQRSGVRASESSGGSSTSTTRTSTNTWINRHEDIVTDVIYQRAAAILQMHEGLLRWRHKYEIPEMTDESLVSTAEPLQLVHYDVGQQYNAHHDFVMPGMVAGQPSRFATLLLYLNEPEEGGATTFPLWRNGETDRPLSVQPVTGKAVLFYSLLPDGNYDARSLHEAEAVKKGEKYLANLWIWDPIMDHTVAKLG